MTKIIMHGCNGHMGQTITRLAESMKDLSIVAGIDLEGEQKNEDVLAQLKKITDNK